MKTKKKKEIKIEVIREVIQKECLECGQMVTVKANGYEAQGVFNVFCHDKDCEDRYAFKQ